MVSLAHSVGETLSGNPVLHRGHRPAARCRKTSTRLARLVIMRQRHVDGRKAVCRLPRTAVRDRRASGKAGPGRGTTGSRLSSADVGA